MWSSGCGGETADSVGADQQRRCTVEKQLTLLVLVGSVGALEPPSCFTREIAQIILRFTPVGQQRNDASGGVNELTLTSLSSLLLL